MCFERSSLERLKVIKLIIYHLLVFFLIYQRTQKIEFIFSDAPKNLCIFLLTSREELYILCALLDKEISIMEITFVSCMFFLTISIMFRTNFIPKEIKL